ncbi:MAG: hypothetical protein ABI678_01435 [Kofleriaceae bacterium]
MRMALLVLLAACGTPPPEWTADAGACVGYAMPPGTDLTAPTVSFKTDVMPVLTANCASSSCHGISDNPQGGLFLGAQQKKGADAATVYQKLVGPMAGQLSTMPYVTPNDPAKSYLMHKLDGDQCQFEAACTNGNCARSMPYDRSLAVETRDIVRRWISQGATQ